MTVWKLRCGDTTSGRDYGHVCITAGLALLGTEWLDSQLRVPDANLEDINRQRCSENDSQSRFVRALDQMACDDIVALVHGTSLRAIGTVREGNPLPIGVDIAGAGLLDIDGWSLPIAREVNWRVPPNPNPEAIAPLNLNRHRFSGVGEPTADIIRALHADAFREGTNWCPGGNWSDFLNRATDVKAVQPEALPDIFDCAKYYRNGIGIPPREHEVVCHLVVPFLKSLGWEAPRQIEIEGGYIDVVLYADQDRRKPRVLVEAKGAWGSTTGSLEQIRRYYHNYEHRDEVTAIVTTTGTRWAVWTTGDAPRLQAYCDLTATEHLAEHLLLEGLAPPNDSVKGLSRVMELLRVPQEPQ